MADAKNGKQMMKAISQIQKNINPVVQQRFNGVVGGAAAVGTGNITEGL